MKPRKPLKRTQMRQGSALKASRKPIPKQSAQVKASLGARRKAKAEVLERDGYLCALVALKPGHRCFGNLEAHHLKKASAGGSYTPDNLLTLCSYANQYVEDHPLEARALGLVR